MRRCLRRTAILALTFLTLASQADAAVIQILGDFEDGDLGAWQQTQWTVSGGAGWYASDSPSESPVNGSPMFPPSGDWQVISDCDGNYATAILFRDFLVPANADTLKLRFWYRSSDVAEMPFLDPGGQAQGVRVDLMSPAQPLTGMAGILATPYESVFPSPDDLTPRTLTLGVQAWRGQTVRLRVAAVSNLAVMVAGVDDVRLEGSPYVEVATSLPQLHDGAADWGDYDHDGDLDLAIMGRDAANDRVSSIWRNDAGSFVKLLDLPSVVRFGDLKWVDLDRDGDLDLVALGDPVAGNPGLQVAGVNQGGGAFTWTATGSVLLHGNLALADFDADGDQDLATAYYAYKAILTNPGTGSVTQTLLSGGPGSAIDSTFARWMRGPYPDYYATGSPIFPGTWPQAEHLYLNNAGSGFTWSSTGSIGYSSRWWTDADADADGDEESFHTGRASGATSNVVRLWRPSTNTDVPHDVPAVHQPFAIWMDDDADGDMDLLVGGTRPSGRYTKIHRWNGTGLAAGSDVFAQFGHLGCAFGDHDGDGDPDLLLMGDTSTGPMTKLYVNTSLTPNAAPSAPASISATWTASDLTLACATAADDHTPAPGLTYNFRAGTTPGSANLVTSDADAATGRRWVAREGNTNATNLREYVRRWSDILAERQTAIHWSAQAIDGARLGGAWAPEGRLQLSGLIASITDVPADQGGQVRVRITPSDFDTAPTSPVTFTSYGVWQRVDAAAQQAEIARVAADATARPTAKVAAGALATVPFGGRTWLPAGTASAAGFPAGTWELLATVPVLQLPEYLVRVTTVADSGATGTHWSVYVVTSHTSSPSVWWASAPDSGKSVDNIAPGVPQGLAAEYHTGGGNALSWQPSADEDFQYFRVYRGDTPGFTIAPVALVANVAGTSWNDPAHDAPGVYYKVTAVDHNGNESAAASPGSTTGASPGPGPAFALAAPSPSPFAGSTRLAFALPAASDVTLEAFDAVGRRVRTLARGRFAAGTHELFWDGRGDDGNALGAGLHFVRLRAAGQEAVRRVVSLGGGR